jgi:hypothetical protein
MFLGPGRRCVSTTGGTATSARTLWSFWKRVEQGNWKRYKIGDSVVVARRFRFDYLYITLVIIELLFYGLESAPGAGSLVAAFLRTFFSSP